MLLIKRIGFRAVARFVPNRWLWEHYAPFVHVLRESYNYNEAVNKLLDYLKPSHSDRVLDVGCGDGYSLEKYINDYKMKVGVDFSSRMLKRAKSRLDSNAKMGSDTKMKSDIGLVNADLNHNLPFCSSYFTKVYSVLVLGYLQKRRNFITEIYRVSDHGARVGVITPVKNARFLSVFINEIRRRRRDNTFIKELLTSKGAGRVLVGLSALIFGKLAEIKNLLGEFHFYTEKTIREDFEKAGFINVRTELTYGGSAILLLAEKRTKDITSINSVMSEVLVRLQ